MELYEAKTKTQIIDNSRRSGTYAKDNQLLGKNRYERRKHSSISKSVRDYSRINMNTFFKRDILDFSIQVRGETNNYLVKLKLVGILRELQDELAKDKREVEWKHIMNAITRVFNNKNIYAWCSCDDWKYRFQHWSCVGDFAYDERDPGPGKRIANPNNDKGDGCKHVLLVLSNSSWRVQLAKAIINYINRLKERQERLYQTIVFPAIYGEKYSDEIQQELINPDTGKKSRDYLPSSRKELQQADDDAINRGRFQKGNTKGIRFTKDEPEDQIELDLGANNEESK